LERVDEQKNDGRTIGIISPSERGQDQSNRFHDSKFGDDAKKSVISKDSHNVT